MSSANAISMIIREFFNKFTKSYCEPLSNNNVNFDFNDGFSVENLILKPEPLNSIFEAAETDVRILCGNMSKLRMRYNPIPGTISMNISEIEICLQPNTMKSIKRAIKTTFDDIITTEQQYFKRLPYVVDNFKPHLVKKNTKSGCCGIGEPVIEEYTVIGPPNTHYLNYNYDYENPRAQEEHQNSYMHKNYNHASYPPNPYSIHTPQVQKNKYSNDIYFSQTEYVKPTYNYSQSAEPHRNHKFNNEMTRSRPNLVHFEPKTVNQAPYISNIENFNSSSAPKYESPYQKKHDNSIHKNKSYPGPYNDNFDEKNAEIGRFRQIEYKDILYPKELTPSKENLTNSIQNQEFIPDKINNSNSVNEIIYLTKEIPSSSPKKLDVETSGPKYFSQAFSAAGKYEK